MEQNLNQYKIFYTVAKAKNISHAANELYISQPAISKAISKLEETLNTKLFIRSQRGVILTSEGTVLFDHLCTAFEAIDAGEENIKKMHDLGIGHIKIGASSSFCKFILIPYLKEFIREYPHIKISISSQSSTDNIKLLNEDKIDIALVVKSEASNNFEFLEVGKFEDIFIATPEYLANLNDRIGIDAVDKSFYKDIFNYANFLMLDKNNLTRTYVDNYCLKNGIEIRNILEVNNMDLLIELTKIGIGVGCVIKQFVEKELNQGIIKEIPLNTKFYQRTVGFVYKNNISCYETIGKFIEFINKKLTN